MIESREGLLRNIPNMRSILKMIRKHFQTALFLKSLSNPKKSKFEQKNKNILISKASQAVSKQSGKKNK